MNASSEILFDFSEGIAEVTLNRPRSLNALTLEMVRQLDPQLSLWQEDSRVRAVLVRGGGGKAFCAGGDIQKLYEDSTGATIRRDFFREEYRLNRRIHNFAKPYIAIMNGITMGGGVGLSVHAKVRIATENTLFAMPETGIGLFPDVGGSWFLPRLPGEIGMYLALTGARLNGADCIYSRICDYFIPSDGHNKLLSILRKGEPISDTLMLLCRVPAASSLALHREAIDRCFSGNSVEEILQNLSGVGSDWAGEQISLISSKSPTSLKISFQQLRRGKRLDFDSCMKMEYRLSQHVMAGHDFFEGVRSVVVDRDNTPKWSPSSLFELSESDVEKYFDPLAEDDLSFPL